MAKFSLQRLIALANRLYPPSSTSIHQPGVLNENVQLVQDVWPPSWSFDGISTEEVTGGVGSINVVSSTVPTGRYRWVHACSLLQLSGATVLAHNYGISLLQVASALGVTVEQPFPSQSGIQTYGAAFPANVVVACRRSLIVPQGYAVQGFSTVTEGVLQLRLQMMFRELNIGEPFHSV